MKEIETFKEAFEAYKGLFDEAVAQTTLHPELYFAKWIYLYYKHYPHLMKDEANAFLYHYARRSFLMSCDSVLGPKAGLLQREEMMERKGLLNEAEVERYAALAKWLGGLLRAWRGET